MTLTTVLIQMLFTLIFAAILVGWFSWPASKANSRKEATLWARGYDLELTERNWPMVNYYVRLAIVLRVVGGVGGLVLGALFDDATGLDTSSGAGFWIWIVLGWLSGASWAEYRLTRPPSAGQVASLTPRQVSDYLPSWLYAAPLVAAAIVVAIAAGGIVARDPQVPQAEPPPTVALLAAAAGAVVLSAVIRRAVRTVVGRRQPTGPSDIVAADDAIRASAVHHLAGGGTAAILLIAAQIALSTMAPYHVPFGLRAWVPAVLLVAAVLAWRFCAYLRWRVRRGDQAVTVRA